MCSSDLSAEGLIEGDPRAVDARGRRLESILPCGFIGTWNARQGLTVRRVDLRDDGRYDMSPAPHSADPVKGYHGRWAVQGGQMLWRDSLAPDTLDTNLIVAQGADHFELAEHNGSRTRFERIEARASTRCTP